MCIGPGNGASERHSDSETHSDSEADGDSEADRDRVRQVVWDPWWFVLSADSQQLIYYTRPGGQQAGQIQLTASCPVLHGDELHLDSTIGTEHHRVRFPGFPGEPSVGSWELALLESVRLLHEHSVHHSQSRVVLSCNVSRVSIQNIGDSGNCVVVVDNIAGQVISESALAAMSEAEVSTAFNDLCYTQGLTEVSLEKLQDAAKRMVLRFASRDSEYLRAPSQLHIQLGAPKHCQQIMAELRATQGSAMSTQQSIDRRISLFNFFTDEARDATVELSLLSSQGEREVAPFTVLCLIHLSLFPVSVCILSRTLSRFLSLSLSLFLFLSLLLSLSPSHLIAPV